MAIVTISVNKEELNQKKQKLIAVGTATVRRLEKGGLKVIDFTHKFAVGFAHKHSKGGKDVI